MDIVDHLRVKTSFVLHRRLMRFVLEQ